MLKLKNIENLKRSCNKYYIKEERYQLVLTSPPKYRTKSSVRKLFTLLRHFLNILEKKSNNNFKPCPHIALNTTNPNPIFKIKIYCTKTPNITKYFRNLEK